MRRYKPKKRFKKYKKRKSFLKSRFFWGSILIFALIILIFYFLLLSPVFKIKEIKIAGPRDIPYYELKNLLEKELEKNFLYFFQKNSFFLINSDEIESKILKEYPEIKEAALKKKFPRSSLLEIQPREVIGLWCFSEANCFLIDEKGIIYGELFSATLEDREREDLIMIFPIEEEIKKPGENVISPEKMSQFLKIKSELEKLGINLKKFVLKENQRLDVKTIEEWEIYFDLSSDINLALTKLSLLLEKEIPPEQRKNLQYIDLRFSKVYYK